MIQLTVTNHYKIVTINTRCWQVFPILKVGSAIVERIRNVLTHGKQTGLYEKIPRFGPVYYEQA